MASAELHAAIDRTLLERLQIVVKKVCDENLEAQAMFEKYLLVSPRVESESKAGAAGKKRARFVLCRNCKDEFDVTQNTDKSCKYHPGNLEAAYDAGRWDDHDEDCHGTIDTDEMREEFPDGFTWDCCEENGEASGCETGPHEDDTSFKPASKRPKVWD